MNVLQHTRNERNPCLKQNRPDRSYRDTLLKLIQLFCVRLNVWYKVLEENGARWKILEFYLTLKNNFELANTYEFKFV